MAYMSHMGWTRVHSNEMEECAGPTTGLARSFGKNRTYILCNNVYALLFIYSEKI